MKLPAIPYNRACTTGELKSLIEYMLDPDNKNPMLLENDIVFGIFPKTMEEDHNGTVHYQAIDILRPGVVVPILAYDGISLDQKDDVIQLVDSWTTQCSVISILFALEKMDQEKFFDEPIGNFNFMTYINECVKSGALKKSDFVSVIWFPERPGAKALDKNLEIKIDKEEY